MKILKQAPPSPLLLRIITAGMNPQSDTLFPWAPDIYNPSGLDIPPDIFVHELQHIVQQGKNPKEWWDRYILDKNFRLNQEIEANREQYKFFCKVKKDRNERARALIKMANNLAGEVYGSIISQQEAIELIK